MNKIIIMFLTIMLVLGSINNISFATSDEDFIKVMEEVIKLKEIIDISNTKVYELLEKGIVKGDERGIRLNDSISRAEISVVVIRMLDEKEKGKTEYTFESLADASRYFPSNYKDLKNSHWANGYINIMDGKGLISGYPDKTFKPDASITYAEVVSILVRSVNGLNEEQIKNSVWPTTYLAKGVELGIINNIQIKDFNEKATREIVFEMIYNTINR